MQMRWIIIILALATSCGQRQSETNPGNAQDLKTLGVTEASADLPPPSPEAAPDTAAAPQIAYRYSFGYRLSAGSIAAVQAQHMALCDTLSNTVCTIVSMRQASSDGEFSSASLTLLVESNRARTFGAALDKAAVASGGETRNREIDAEDLSKQMSDTAAKIKAKQALADRLLLLLQNQSGKVGELVEAERAFAAAQEELDAARSWMAEMRGRVSMSTIEISYASAAPAGNGLLRPVRDSLAAAGQSLGESFAVLITVAVVLLPWVGALGGLIWLLRKRGGLRRLRARWPRKAGPSVVTDKAS